MTARETSTAGIKSDISPALVGVIADPRSTQMEVRVYGEGTVTFWWKVSSDYADELQFYIDGDPKDAIDGEADWAQKSYEIDGNEPHSLLWQYTKDGDGSGGSDCGWVDYIQWSGFTPTEPPGTWETLSYVYDHDGRRITKKYDGQTVLTYVYACPELAERDGDHCIAEYNGAGALQRKYIYGPGVDQPICMIEGAATSYYHFDGLGSVIALTDANGDIEQEYEYSIWGQVGASDPSHTNPYMFTGRRFDTETGLYYYRARYYHPEIGRFLQTDPIGYGDGMNWYAYCANRPVLLSDPYGNIAVCFYDPREFMKDPPHSSMFGEAANDFTSYDPNTWPGSFEMTSCKDVIDKLKELNAMGVEVTSIYFYDHCRTAPFNSLELYSLEFGSDKVRPDKESRFWSDLRANTDPCCVLHFRQCLAGQGVEDIATWTQRAATGCTQWVDYLSAERGQSQKVDIPDYDFKGPVVIASPEVKKNEKGEGVAVGVTVDWYWRYKPGELGTGKQPY